MLRALIFGIAGLTAFLPAWAATYTDPDLITNMSVGLDHARVKTATMVQAEGCSNAAWYILDFTSTANPEMYAMLLAAKASGQKVHFQLSGCRDGYAKVTHVYNCNNASCTN